MQTSTAVVIGGGVIGLSSAYQLARKGVGRVVLLEKGPVGDGASSRAAGIITGLMWSTPGILARKVSLALYRQLSQELNGYHFHGVGCLNLFDPDSWPERQRLLPLYDQHEVPYEILDAQEMRYRWPDLNPDDSLIGLHDPLGGYSEPQDYLPALAARVRELGVEIQEGRQVVDFTTHGGRVTGVVTDQGPIGADAVVSTVHVWTLQLLGRLGLRYPMKAFVHQRYVTTSQSRAFGLPAVNANPLGGYVRPAHGNRLLAGIETAERLEHPVSDSRFHMSSLSAPDSLKEQIRADFTETVPRLASAQWEAEKVGLISFAVDGEPILGPVSALPGLYVGMAFHSGGFAYNPVAGLLLAEYVADGQTSIDVRDFSPERFQGMDIESFLNTPVTQANAVRRRH